jgi:hypothetical protein
MSYNSIVYCNKCLLNPNSHSFRILNCSDTTNNPVLYTKIADAENYNDTDGILNHYRELLNLLENREWIWIFDCNDLEIKHCFEIKTSLGIIDILQKNNKNKQILIINSNIFLTIIINSIKLFMDNSISDKIKIFKKDEKDLLIEELELLNINFDIIK